MNLLGRAALVTGASGGLGRAIAIGLAEAGADVVCHARDADRAMATVASVQALGRRSALVIADLRDGASAASGVVQQAVDSMGQLDILVNNAGVMSVRPFLELTEREWRDVVDTNLTGYFLMGQAAARVMAESGYGRIINVSSTRQEQAWPGNAAYASSKGGVFMLTRVMALELASFGVRVNSVAPGTIETDLNRSYLSDVEFRQRRVDRIPVGRLGTPSDVVAAAVLLASPQADFINGASIVIDGGQTIW